MVTDGENARRARELRSEFGSLAAYFWRYEDRGPFPGIVATTEASHALSKDLRKRGFPDGTIDFNDDNTWRSYHRFARKMPHRRDLALGYGRDRRSYVDSNHDPISQIESGP